MGLFAEWQPQYAEQGIATFPVRDKTPAVRHYLKVGQRASSQFAARFKTSDAFGLACRPNRITVLDVDSPDERLLADALDEFGPTPFLVRSGSGNYQAWYRRTAEGRRIRPDPARPIDILGDGYVVAPPSAGSKGSYSIIAGSLDDLATLPAMRFVAPTEALPALQPMSDGQIGTGKRNDELWRACMKLALSCGSMHELMTKAGAINAATFYEPLPDDEVLKVVASALLKTERNENWFGGGKVAFDQTEIDELLSDDPDAFILLTILRRHHWRKEFAVANAMCAAMPRGGWTRQRFTAARSRLIASGEIVEVRAVTRHAPATYRFRVSRIRHQ